MPDTSTPDLAALGRLAGTWTTEATHPALPGVVVHGTAEMQWLEGEKFLILRARTDHPDFPDSVSIIGAMGQDRVDPRAPGAPADSDAAQLNMHYYDSRGVFRVLSARIDDKTWQLERLAEGFSQRFTGTFTDSYNTITGLWKLRTDADHWEDDLKIAYRRRTP